MTIYFKPEGIIGRDKSRGLPKPAALFVGNFSSAQTTVRELKYNQTKNMILYFRLEDDEKEAEEEEKE